METIEFKQSYQDVIDELLRTKNHYSVMVAAVMDLAIQQRPLAGDQLELRKRAAISLRTLIHYAETTITKLDQKKTGGTVGI